MSAIRVIAIGGAAVGALVGLGATWQAWASRRDEARYPPPGELVDVGGHRLHLRVTGEPTVAPVVVLEAGIGSMSSNWAWVQGELARDGRVVSYDRAGLGWSDASGGGVDAATAAAELHAALGAAGIGPPYVLGGHSYGGLVARMFADRYPDEVVGLALVDSSHPDQWAHIPASRDGRTVALSNRMMALFARLGLLRLFAAERPYIDGLPPREYAEMRAYLARPQGWSAAADALLAWGRLSRAQVNAAPGLGDLPLVVLSVTEQHRYADVLTRLQDELVTLSSHSRHVTVDGATHYTLVSRQEHAAIVSDAIRGVIRAASDGALRRTAAPPQSPPPAGPADSP